MAQLKDFFPPPNMMVELEPEENASFLLDYLCTEQEANKTSFHGVDRNNIVTSSPVVQYAREFQYDADKIGKAITEAWCWLEKEIMIAPQPGQSMGNWVYVTKKGFKYRNKADLETYRKGGLLPKESLDKKLVEKVYPLFLRGDYDTAVFQAFKEVEVRVRKKAGLPNDLIGVQLMRKAFHPDEGKLTNRESLPAERQSLSDLFSGSIGSFKNPSSHREIDLNNPHEASEIILFANYLLRLVDKCKLNP
jgi:uncharacterized protein (TIGR02391 family)